MTVRAVRPWRYRLIETEDGGVLDLHVESGHANWDEEHPLGPKALEALADDPVRADLLFAALHAVRQGRERVPADLIDLVALGDEGDVSRRLDAIDRARKGACSNMMRILRGRPERTWFGGWFGGRPPA